MADKLFIDVNIILDVAAERQPHLGASQKILSLIESGKVRGYISAASFPILYYLLEKEIGDDAAREYLEVLSDLLTVVPLGRRELLRAMRIRTNDYEDALQAASAEACGADRIITRDLKGYRGSPVKAVTAVGYLEGLK